MDLYVPRCTIAHGRNVFCPPVAAAVQWGPVIDPFLLPIQPMAAIASGAIFNPADILLGHNTDEMAMFVDESSYGKSYPYTAYESVLLGVFGWSVVRTRTQLMHSHSVLCSRVCDSSAVDTGD